MIPARIGSKRLPRKNLLPLGGRPLLAHTVDAAREAGVFDEIVVSSDDDEILALAGLLGVAADRRPAALAGDRTRFVEVLEELLLRTGAAPRFDLVAVLLPTCPFRHPDDIRAVLDLQRRTGGFVIAVCAYEFPPQFALRLGDDGRATMEHPEAWRRSTQSQSHPASYHPNGAIYLAPTDRFLAERTFFAEPLFAHVMPPERSLDIDLPHQLAVAESLLRRRGFRAVRKT
jgi:CMP-N-acetylneuraminic acid synthetase